MRINAEHKPGIKGYYILYIVPLVAFLVVSLLIPMILNTPPADFYAIVTYIFIAFFTAIASGVIIAIIFHSDKKFAATVLIDSVAIAFILAPILTMYPVHPAFVTLVGITFQFLNTYTQVFLEIDLIASPFAAYWIITAIKADRFYKYKAIAIALNLVLLIVDFVLSYYVLQLFTAPLHYLIA